MGQFMGLSDEELERRAQGITIEKCYTSTLYIKGAESIKLDDVDLATIRKHVLDELYRRTEEAILDPDFGNPNIIRGCRSRPVPMQLGTGDADEVDTREAD